jgi:hypothetical protein
VLHLRQSRRTSEGDVAAILVKSHKQREEKKDA